MLVEDLRLICKRLLFFVYLEMSLRDQSLSLLKPVTLSSSIHRRQKQWSL
jgi:hypothetical protein